MARIEVRAVSVLLGALALAVVMILVFAPPGETQTAPGEADLKLEKYAFDDIVAVGDEIQFSIGISNLGPNVAPNVTVTDVLPATVEILFVFVGNSEDEGSDSCTTSAGNVITCDLGDIAPGIESSIAIGVCATEPGIVENTATVDSDTFDPNPTNNTDTATTTVIPETPEQCPEPIDPDVPPIDPGMPFPDRPLPSEEQLPTASPTTINSPTTIFAPSIDADQETEQDSGDVDQQMEGSPGGLQNANTGNFSVPDQDITW